VLQVSSTTVGSSGRTPIAVSSCEAADALTELVATRRLLLVVDAAADPTTLSSASAAACPTARSLSPAKKHRSPAAAFRGTTRKMQ
jgi:hypothetical protein